MITIKNKQALTKMSIAGQHLARILQDITDRVRPGVTTLELDQWIGQQQKDCGLVSMMKGYKGYRYVSCISLNDVVVHGIPNERTVLKLGDLVKIDVCASFKGYGADLARCYVVGSVPAPIKKLVEVAQNALDKGIEQMAVGNHLSDISVAIQREVERHGFGVVRIFAGHGIGKRMHEDPEILNYGEPGKGPILRQGMTFAIEPMITMGSYEVYIDKDGWTAKTRDGSLAAHVEDTVAVTQGDPCVLTRLSAH